MKTRVLITDNVESSCAQVLRAEGFQVDQKPPLKTGELKEIIGNYEVLIVRSSTKVTEDVLSSAGALKVIGRAGAGVDTIDVDAATRHGVVVMNTPGGNTISTAEHTMSLLLSMVRNIPQAHASLVSGKWDRKAYIGTELQGKTIGIIGLGKIGREVAVRCQAFGMTAIGFDPLLGADQAGRLGIEVLSLEDVFTRSDIITVHTPLNDETRGLISDPQLAKCKDGVRLVNCARGGIIDEDALLRALDSGKVAGAALDVFVKEPPGDHALLKHPKVVVTPHLGASTEEAQDKVARQIASQVADFLKGHTIAGAVNADVLAQALHDETKPFAILAEKLGMFQAQLLEGPLESLTVTCGGPLLSGVAELMTSAMLKGFLSQLVSEPVHLINAHVKARERGIAVGQKSVPAAGPYTNLLRVECASGGRMRSVGGTVFGSDLLRIVQIDGYHLEITPQGHLLVYKNIDRPGMLAAAGSMLASEGINIAALALGRLGPGGSAMTVMNVDSPITGAVLGRLQGLEGVSEVRAVRL
jgi:D-3-phosphoglycerate dehydrogenase / 2-oxoglutarate reductase